MRLISFSFLLILLSSCGGADNAEIVNPFEFVVTERGAEETLETSFVDVDSLADVVYANIPEEILEIENEDGSLALDGTEWILTSYIPANGVKSLAEPKVGGKRHTLYFETQDVDLSEYQDDLSADELSYFEENEIKTVSGFILCNTFGANSNYAHPSISFDSVRRTGSLCSGAPFTPTDEYVSGLLFNQDSLNVTFIDNRLILTHPSGEQLIYGPPGSSDSSTAPIGDKCLAFSSNVLDFGEVSADTWAQWYSPLELRYTKNPSEMSNVIDQFGDTFIRTRLKPTNTGSTHVQAGAYLPPAKKYLVSQSVMFETGFDWGGAHQGGKFGFGLGSEKSVSGGDTSTDGFTLRYMWRGNYDGTARMALYSYASDRFIEYPGAYPYGADYHIGYTIPTGEWIDLSLELTANTTIGASDGSVRAWINGELAVEKNNIQWQASGSEPLMTRMSFANFHGGNSALWAPASTTYIRFKNVCISDAS